MKYYNAIYLFSSKMVQIMNLANNCTNTKAALALANCFCKAAEALELDIPDNVVEIAFYNTGIAAYMFGECSTANPKGKEEKLDEIYDTVYYSLRVVIDKILDAGFIQDTDFTLTRGYPVFKRVTF